MYAAIVLLDITCSPYLLTMTFSDCSCVSGQAGKGGLLLHVSISSDVNIESTSQPGSLNIYLIDFECQVE